MEHMLKRNTYKPTGIYIRSYIKNNCFIELCKLHEFKAFILYISINIDLRLRFLMIWSMDGRFWTLGAPVTHTKQAGHHEAVQHVVRSEQAGHRARRAGHRARWAGGSWRQIWIGRLLVVTTPFCSPIWGPNLIISILLVICKYFNAKMSFYLQDFNSRDKFGFRDNFETIYCEELVKSRL